MTGGGPRPPSWGRTAILNLRSLSCGGLGVGEVRMGHAHPYQLDFVEGVHILLLYVTSAFHVLPTFHNEASVHANLEKKKKLSTLR